MTEEHMATSFFLGIKVAEHVHKIRRTLEDKMHDKIFETLQAIAEGELTLMNTPEEEIAGLPEPSPNIKDALEQHLREMIRIGRQNERIVAEILVKNVPN